MGNLDCARTAVTSADPSRRLARYRVSSRVVMGAEAKSSSIERGGPLLGVAKLVFLLAAYGTTLALTRLLDPDEVGRYHVIARLIAVPNMILIQTVTFSVSRPLAEQYLQGFPAYDALRRRGFRLAALLGGGVSLIFLASASGLAAALRDPTLRDPILVVAPISAIYAFYAVNIGTLNATRFFSRQASLDIFMASCKAGLIVGAAALGLGLATTVGGFTVASAMALTLSFVLVRSARPKSAEGREATSEVPPMAAFAGVLLLFTAITNGLLSADLLILKHFANSASRQAEVGYYASAQLVAQVPYSLLNALSLLIFPLVASLKGPEQKERLDRYVAATIRVALLLLVLMATVAQSSAEEVQALLFPGAYGSAAQALKRLVWGYSGYSLAVIAAWIMNSHRRHRSALVLVAVPLSSAIFLVSRWAPEAGGMGAADAVVVSGAIGGGLALVAVGRVFGAWPSPMFALKLAGLASVVWWVAGRWSPHGKLGILLELTVSTVIFVGLVFVTKIVTWKELRELRRAG